MFNLCEIILSDIFNGWEMLNRRYRKHVLNDASIAFAPGAWRIGKQTYPLVKASVQMLETGPVTRSLKTANLTKAGEI